MTTHSIASSIVVSVHSSVKKNSTNFYGIVIDIKRKVKRGPIMSTLAPDKKIINFQADRGLVDKAKLILEQQSTTMSKAFNLFLKNIVVTKELNLLTEDELEKEQLFKQLQAEAQASYASFEKGDDYTDDKLKERYGL
ncbi:XRE family transcriptional regulator [Streptococcus sobrinus]|nr:hypothetical protein [Streptococcus sobrinus]AWN18081.1 XRE family transcriptional regulator [Streptococcus sobrinus]